MNIQYKTQSEIDIEQWNHCIQQAYNGRVYAFSWYLDAVSEQWDALIIDDYQAVFPIPFKKRMGFFVVYQPFFIQQLGIFSLLPLSSTAQEEILHAIPKKFKIGRLQLNSCNTITDTTFKTRQNINCLLNLENNYHALYSEYSTNVKRHLKKAKNNRLTCRISDSCDPAIQMFQQHKAPTLPPLSDQLYPTLQHLFEVLQQHQSVTVYDAYTNDNQRCASVVLVHDIRCLVYLFSGCTPEAYQNGAQFFLIDHIIQQYAEQSLYFDFEGSNDANLARFYQSFGAEKCYYPVMFFENMFYPMVKILQKLHKI